MLALRACLAGAEETACEVLDEVDSGVSGAVADVVGRLIRELATRRQVLCITHLPQVAAHAEAHLVVKKQVAEGRTFSEVEALEGTAKTQELARMLSRVKVSKQAAGAGEALVRAARGPGGAARRRVTRAVAAREGRRAPAEADAIFAAPARTASRRGRQPHVVSRPGPAPRFTPLGASGQCARSA